MENEGVVNRLKTGIHGLDNIIGGGVPIGSQILILGSPGAGKTLISLEMLYHNSRLAIPSTFITTEERREALIYNVKNAFYSFDDYEDRVENKKINIVHKALVDGFKSRENFEKFVADIVNDMDSNKSKLLVVDSISSIRPILSDDRTFTRSITYMTEVFRDNGITAFMTYESDIKRTDDIMKLGLYSTSMFDGIIKLFVNHMEGSSQYSMEISKLRNSTHKLSTVPYQITDSGFDVLSD